MKRAESIRVECDRKFSKILPILNEVVNSMKAVSK